MLADALSLRPKRLRRQLMVIYGLLPLIIASLVVGGVFLGFYISELVEGRSSVVFPLIFSTVGLALSILVSIKIAERMAS